MTVRILKGDCREVLRGLPDESVHCVVTSPPYFGLRDYGVAGQIGLEATPDVYVAEMVAVFAEVRRVLRDDGVLFLNLGDSYWTSGPRHTGRNDTKRETPGGRGGSFRGGVRRAISCDTGDKEPEDFPTHDCLCGSLCDACRAAYQIGKFHTGNQRAPMLGASIPASIRERKALPSGHLPTSGLMHPVGHNEASILDLAPMPRHEGEPLLASHASMTTESSQQHQEGFRQSGNPSVCLVCGATLQGSARASAHTAACICDTAAGALADRKIGRDALGSAYPDFTTASLKPKDLIGIPWRVAFALQADGWVLRQEIVWSKPNPMPESVRDRCTKSHEQLFLFAKAKWSGPPPGRYAHITPQDARWLALFFDAEGNLCLRRESAKGNDYGAHSAQIVLANSNRPLLETAQKIVGDGSILERPGTNAPMFYWQLCGKKAADLLSVLYPHFIVKQRQARCLLHLETLKVMRGGHARLATDAVAYRDRLWSAVKELNHFGNPDLSWVPEPQLGRWADCERYYYDQDAIRNEPTGRAEPIKFGNVGSNRAVQGGRDKKGGAFDADGLKGANRRSVWDVATEPYSEAHFATFPPALIEPCILAGCPENVCSECGAPVVRDVERTPMVLARSERTHDRGQTRSSGTMLAPPTSVTKGWLASCDCNATTRRGTVLDPFGGAGTTGLVADRLGRSAILIELNPEYAAMAERRISGDAPLFADVKAEL